MTANNETSQTGHNRDRDLDPAFEWYKQEHATLTRHFEEVWKSGALNFSYLAVISAAMLAFGTNRLQVEAALLLSVVPILAWYFCIYKIFARCVQSLGDRLHDIEEQIQQFYGICGGKFLPAGGHFFCWQERYHAKQIQMVSKLILGVIIGLILFILSLFLAKGIAPEKYEEIRNKYIIAPETKRLEDIEHKIKVIENKTGESAAKSEVITKSVKAIETKMEVLSTEMEKRWARLSEKEKKNS